MLAQIHIAPLRVSFGLDLLSDRLDKIYQAHAKAQRARLVARRKEACKLHKQSFGSMCKQIKGAASSPLCRLRDPAKGPGAIATHPKRLDAIVRDVIGPDLSGQCYVRPSPSHDPHFLEEVRQALSAPTARAR